MAGFRLEEKCKALAQESDAEKKTVKTFELAEEFLHYNDEMFTFERKRIGRSIIKALPLGSSSADVKKLVRERVAMERRFGEPNVDWWLY